MQYIVSSRGRPIGTTDLGFVHVDPRSRFGWFPAEIPVPEFFDDAAPVSADAIP